MNADARTSPTSAAAMSGLDLGIGVSLPGPLRRWRRRLDPENFSRSFAKLCSRAGLGRWHPHELRHSGASLMLAQGTPLHVVSEILGHASITITKDVYGHLVEGDRRAVAASMSQALFGPEPAPVAPSVAPTGTKKAPPRGE